MPFPPSVRRQRGHVLAVADDHDEDRLGRRRALDPLDQSIAQVGTQGHQAQHQAGEQAEEQADRDPATHVCPIGAEPRAPDRSGAGLATRAAAGHNTASQVEVRCPSGA